MTNSSTHRGADQHLPLSAVDFLVLLVLADGDSHGYAMVKEIAGRSKGRIRMLPGNFYAVLHRLAREGLIAESDRRPGGPDEDKRRRYFRITRLGREVAAAEVSRMKEMVTAAESSELATEPSR